MNKDHPKARVVPFSSVVGSSVTLHDPETERVIGQLGIMNVGGDTPADWKARSIAVAEDTARRINGNALHLVAVDGCAVLRIERGKGDWVELIREPLDGPFSHIIEPAGIDAALAKADAGTVRLGEIGE
jgi:hypothetical protein